MNPTSQIVDSSWGEPERAPRQRDFIAHACVSMLAWTDHLYYEDRALALGG